MEWLIIGTVTILISGIFIAGWKFGGNAKQKTMENSALRDINSHYEKMSDKFNQIDDAIDAVHSMLGDSHGVREKD